MNLRDELIKVTIDTTNDLTARETEVCKQYAVQAAGYLALVKLLGHAAPTQQGERSDG